MPVYCAGVSELAGAQRSGHGWLSGGAGRRAIAPGDILVGDRDGIVVVPRQEAKTVLSRLAAVGRPSRLLMPRCAKVLKCLTSLRPSSNLTGRATSTDSENRDPAQGQAKPCQFRWAIPEHVARQFHPSRPFHGGNTGSSPVGRASKFQGKIRYLAGWCRCTNAAKAKIRAKWNPYGGAVRLSYCVFRGSSAGLIYLTAHGPLLLSWSTVSSSK